jgi:hypothetical protein
VFSNDLRKEKGSCQITRPEVEVQFPQIRANNSPHFTFQGKVQVKLNLCQIKHHAFKMSEGVEVKTDIFLTLVLDE